MRKRQRGIERKTKRYREKDKEREREKGRSSGGSSESVELQLFKAIFAHAAVAGRHAVALARADEL